MKSSHLARLLLVVALASASGCENTPNKSGVPWWPQGPGNPPGSETAKTTAANATSEAAEKPTQTSTAPAPASAAAATASVAEGGQTQATRYGDLLFDSGQSAADSGDIAQQTHAVMQKIAAILDGHRLTMANVVHVSVQLADIKELPGMEAAYASHFRGALPARTVAEVAHLPGNALVQITVVAGR
jgi:2-iminobutanoate/2-iminopropanoate deaminase